jgi:hypothetical protein
LAVCAVWDTTWHNTDLSRSGQARFFTMTVTKMQSYKSIKQMDLTLGEIDAIFRELFSRGLLQEVVTTTSRV